ncbi:MAG: NusG domain II-containing protein [Tissierellia bacterium]|nr:NusG domain II-containing protein [Tissierellia bacterium]
MKKGDVILIIGIVLFSLSSIFYIKNFLNRDTDTKYLSVQVNGQEINAIDILDPDNDQEFEINTEYGKNTVIIEDGYVRIRSANCPDQVCVIHKKISKTGETIVCLPNKLVLEIKGDNNDEIEIDSINK